MRAVIQLYGDEGITKPVFNAIRQTFLPVKSPQYDDLSLEYYDKGSLVFHNDEQEINICIFCFDATDNTYEATIKNLEDTAYEMGDKPFVIIPVARNARKLQEDQRKKLLNKGIIIENNAAKAAAMILESCLNVVSESQCSLIDNIIQGSLLFQDFCILRKQISNSSLRENQKNDLYKEINILLANPEKAASQNAFIHHFRETLEGEHYALIDSLLDFLFLVVAVTVACIFPPVFFAISGLTSLAYITQLIIVQPQSPNGSLQPKHSNTNLFSWYNPLSFFNKNKQAVLQFVDHCTPENIRNNMEP